MDNGKVRLHSNDPVKECMSAGFFPDSRLFPKIVRVGDGEYDTKYYPKVSSLKNTLVPLHYEYYKLLREVQNTFGMMSPYDGYSVLCKSFSKLPKYLKDNLQEAIDGLVNYGSDIKFEISPRNVAVTKTGKLILLDCFCLVTKIPRNHHD